MTIRVVLGDDHLLVRASLRALLDCADVEVVCEAGDGRELLRDVRIHQPEVALVDLSMPLLNGLEVMRRIPHVAPCTRVVVLSMFGDAEYVSRAKEAGAWGYVVKDEAPQRLVEVIQRVARGERCLPDAAGATRDLLSPKEREILQLIAEGKRNEQIAEIMHRSVHTVRNHRARLMRKLDVRSASDLVAVAEERGLIRLTPVGKGGS